MYYIYHLCLLFDFSLRINYLLMLRRICESRYASSLAFKRPLDKQSNALERSANNRPKALQLSKLYLTLF